MQDFKNFDPQRLELLEARFKGNRQAPIVISDDEHEHQREQRNSNDSVETGSRSSHAEDHDIKITPQRKERRRKRRTPASENSNDGALSEPGVKLPRTSGSPQTIGNGRGSAKKNKKKTTELGPIMGDPTVEHQDQSFADPMGHGGKKISEYFRTSGVTGSPGRSPAPAKPPTSHAKFPSSPSGKASSGNHLDYSSLHHGQMQQVSPNATRVKPETHSTETQTTMTSSDLSRLSQQESQLKDKNDTIEQLARANKELQRQMELLKKEIQKNSDHLVKCHAVTKELLVKESTIEKKESRIKSMENRLRLGQFTTQRQGAQFVEQWVDGYAFTNLTKNQEKLAKEREELDQQRKLLMKRKPPNQTPSSKVSKPKGNGLDDGFAKPANVCHTPPEYFVRDEVLKLRLAALKKKKVPTATLR